MGQMSILSNLAGQLAAFIAVLLVSSAVHKASKFRRTAEATARLTGLRTEWASPLAMLSIVTEISSALLIFYSDTRQLGAVTVTGLWLFYLAFIVRSLAKGNSGLDCGCSFGKKASPLGPFEIYRNLFLICASAFVGVANEISVPMPIRAFELFVGVAGMAVYATVDQARLTFTEARKK